MEPTDVHADGNAIAGMLHEIFVAEFTTMERTCQSCGDRSSTGAHRSYVSAGIVLRCPACGDVALRVVARAHDTVFELRGTWRASVA